MSSDFPILVTGAAGLIGRHVSERLLQAGRPVIATDRSAPSTPLGCEFVTAELSDSMRLTALVARGVSAILHCGGISGQMLARDNPAGILSINAGGTATLLELARLFRVPRFVLCSSVHAYGDTPEGLDPVTEDAPLAARETYGASKVAAEAALRAYALEHGMQACALRLGWVYGPRRTTPSLTARMVRDAAQGRAVTQVEHDGRYAVPLLHVEDAAAALLAALDAPQVAGCRFNIVGGASLPFTAIAGLITAAQPNWRAEFTPGQALPEYRQGHFSIAAAAQGLGWAPRVTPQQGLADYLAWLRREAF
jgi:nucleoside-diphosphate-sugar epimerase